FLVNIFPVFTTKKQQSMLWSNNFEKASLRLNSVIVGRPKLADIPIQLRLIGRVQPIASVAVRPRVEGQVEQVFVSDGVLVSRGDRIARLDSRNIEARIRQAEANIARSRALFG
ncbi:MAG: biotin/lipoyl-binding protein, partial [Dolichospermum sp.]